MITLLIIIFIVSMIIIKKRESAKDKRDANLHYFGEEFADREYFKDLARQQIKEEDMKEINEHPGNLFIAGRQGWTLPKRVKERTEKLRNEAIQEVQNNEQKGDEELWELKNGK